MSIQAKTLGKSRISEKNRTGSSTRTGQISLTKSAFASLLDSVLYPNPDDTGDPHNPFGPYGPGGPVMQKLLWAALNPQPLPPGPDPYARLLWAALNPQPLPPGPDPYRSAYLARTVIGVAVSQQQFAAVLAGDGQSQRSTEVIGSQIQEFVDEYCATHPRHLPKPKGPRPFDLLLAGAQFQKASDTMSKNPLRSIFASAADQLFKTGLSRIESPSA
jgi:hypothetical protein